MSIIMGKLAGTLVKAMAGATVGRVVTGGINYGLKSTGALRAATDTTKTVVSIGSTVTGLVAGDIVVNKLVDCANGNGTPITGKNQYYAVIETNGECPYPTHGKDIKVGAPKHKANKETVEVEIIDK